MILVVPTKTASGHSTFNTVATVLSIQWQTLLQLIKQGDKISDCDSTALMRLWQLLNAHHRLPPPGASYAPRGRFTPRRTA